MSAMEDYLESLALDYIEARASDHDTLHELADPACTMCHEGIVGGAITDAGTMPDVSCDCIYGHGFDHVVDLVTAGELVERDGKLVRV